MLTLLFWVLIAGVLAWVVNALPIPQPFKTVAWAILIIMLIIVVFEVFGLVHVGVPLR